MRNFCTCAYRQALNGGAGVERRRVDSSEACSLQVVCLCLIVSMQIPGAKVLPDNARSIEIRLANGRVQRGGSGRGKPPSGVLLRAVWLRMHKGSRRHVTGGIGSWPRPVPGRTCKRVAFRTARDVCVCSAQVLGDSFRPRAIATRQRLTRPATLVQPSIQMRKDPAEGDSEWIACDSL
jgi:hypothetical protein